MNDIGLIATDAPTARYDQSLWLSNTSSVSAEVLVTPRMVISESCCMQLAADAERLVLSVGDFSCELNDSLLCQRPCKRKWFLLYTTNLTAYTTNYQYYRAITSKIKYAIKHKIKLKLLQLQQAAAKKHKTSHARPERLLHNCCSPHHFVLACSQWRCTVQSWVSLAGLVLCFIAAACCSCNNFKF